MHSQEGQLALQNGARVINKDLPGLRQGDQEGWGALASAKESGIIGRRTSISPMQARGWHLAKTCS